MVRRLLRSKLRPLAGLAVVLLAVLVSLAVEGSTGRSSALMGTSTEGLINLARGPYVHYVSQRSTYSHECGPGAEKAIDGNNSGTFYPDCSSTHTNHEFSPFWLIKFNGYYYIDHIVIWNRTDCCADRLSNFDVITGGNGLFRYHYYHGGTAARRTEVPINAFGWEIIKVQLRGTNYLTLAEVEVWGRPGR